MSLRLHKTLHAVCPILGVYDSGDNATSSFRPDPSATAGQIAAAQSALASYDRSQAAEDAWELDRLKTQAKGLYDEVSEQAAIDRAIARLMVDEVNFLRQWVMSFKVAVAGAGSLAALKTAVAALPDLPDRTYSQARTAVRNLIDGE